MPDIFSKTKRSAVMAAIRSTGNKSTELQLAVFLRTHRITGWRRHWKILGRPDFFFRAEQVAVFVDGCFWHGCKKCGHIPKSRKAFWKAKIERNKARDKRYNSSLKKAGITVLRVWEHELKNNKSAAKVIANLKKNA